MRRLEQGAEISALLILLTGLGLPSSLGAEPLGQQGSGTQASAETATSAGDAAQVDAATSLPVSLSQIRKDLEKAEAGGGLRGLDETPHFKVEIVEQPQNWVPKLTKEDYSSPAVPGGLYAYELQQVMLPKTQNPLAQPYAAFNSGELLTVSLTTLLQQLLTPKVVKAVEDAQRAHNEQAARDELARALAEYCAAQPNGGAGVFGCETKPAP
jgi:hypothetical protein